MISIVICADLLSCASVSKKTGSWRQLMQNTQATNHIELYHEFYGSGDPILLIHGFGGSTYSWRELIPHLSQRNKIIALDLKGFGKSPKPEDSEYSIYNQASLVINFIQEHELESITLVGHSYGGAVALVVALTMLESNPTLLSKLILIDSVAYAQPMPSFIKVLRTPILRWIVRLILTKKQQVKSVLKLGYYDDDKINDGAVRVYVEALDSPGGKHAIVQVAEQIIPEDIEELCSVYKNIEVPTLILWGREDEIIPLWVGKRLASEMPDSDLVIIEQCGHIPHEEKPEKTIKIITRFLEETTLGARGG